MIVLYFTQSDAGNKLRKENERFLEQFPFSWYFVDKGFPNKELIILNTPLCLG